MDWNEGTQYVAVDTETTGLYWRNGDRPYTVSLCDDQGNNLIWEWDVDPFTRIPSIPKGDLEEIIEYCRGKELVFHNAQFDIGMLNAIGCRLGWRGRVHDTATEFHMCDSDTHAFYKGKLKPLCDRYFGESEDDMIDLHAAVIRARRIAKKLKWNYRISNREHKDAVMEDYWLPKAICTHHPDMLPDITLPDGSEWETGMPTHLHSWYTASSKYANTDTRRTMMLHLACQQELVKRDVAGLYNRERRLIGTITDMCQHGLSLFPERVEKELKSYQRQIDRSAKTLIKLSGLPDEDFNPNSDAQMLKFVQNDLGLKLTEKTQTGRWAFNKSVRDDLVEECYTTRHKDKEVQRKRERWAKAIVLYREGHSAMRYARRYQEKQKDSHYYFSFNQVGTATTRCSSDLHNVGKGKEDEEKSYNLRSMFGPHKGRRWICIDYNQFQLRIFAHVANERTLLKGFEEGLDAHTITAVQIFKKDPDKITKLERRIAKNVNFGFVFGAQPAKIEQTAGMPGLWDDVVRLFPSAHMFMEQVKAEVRKNGFVHTPHGYRLGVTQPHKGVNYIVQGAEGDIVKEAMLNCDRHLKWERKKGIDAFLNFQIHDELIFNVPRNINPSDQHLMIVELINAMMYPGDEVGIHCPVDVEITDTTWDQTVPYEMEVLEHV